MAYLQAIDVDLEGTSLFLAMELVQAPTIGEITREGFIKGWKAQHGYVLLIITWPKTRKT